MSTTGRERRHGVWPASGTCTPAQRSLRHDSLGYRAAFFRYIEAGATPVEWLARVQRLP